MKLNDFYGNTLNIFCDASTRRKGKILDACYGAIATVNNTEIDKIYRISSNSTNNLAEIQAIKAGICLAIKYKDRYDSINLFSDSEISILGIRDRYFKWKVKYNKLYGTNSKLISNQDIFIETMNLICDHNLMITFYHQKGHVSNNIKSIKEAEHVFMASNNIREKIDLNLIRYISYWNDKVDRESRSNLMNTNIYKLNIVRPVHFNVVNFYEQMNHYNNMQYIIKERMYYEKRNNESERNQ